MVRMSSSMRRKTRMMMGTWPLLTWLETGEWPKQGLAPLSSYGWLPLCHPQYNAVRFTAGGLDVNLSGRVGQSCRSVHALMRCSCCCMVQQSSTNVSVQCKLSTHCIVLAVQGGWTVELSELRNQWLGTSPHLTCLLEKMLGMIIQIWMLMPMNVSFWTMTMYLLQLFLQLGHWKNTYQITSFAAMLRRCN